MLPDGHQASSSCPEHLTTPSTHTGGAGEAPEASSSLAAQCAHLCSSPYSQHLAPCWLYSRCSMIHSCNNDNDYLFSYWQPEHQPEDAETREEERDFTSHGQWIRRPSQAWLLLRQSYKHVSRKDWKMGNFCLMVRQSWEEETVKVGSENSGSSSSWLGIYVSTKVQEQTMHSNSLSSPEVTVPGYRWGRASHQTAKPGTSGDMVAMSGTANLEHPSSQQKHLLKGLGRRVETMWLNHGQQQGEK